MRATSSDERTSAAAAAFSSAFFTRRAPQRTAVTPGCAAVQAATSCAVVQACAAQMSVQPSSIAMTRARFSGLYHGIVLRKCAGSSGVSIRIRPVSRPCSNGW